jgi:hypothetical protein
MYILQRSGTHLHISLKKKVYSMESGCAQHHAALCTKPTSCRKHTPYINQSQWFQLRCVLVDSEQPGNTTWITD